MSGMGDSSASSVEPTLEIKTSEPLGTATKSEKGMTKALLVEEYPNMCSALNNLVSSLDNPTVEEVVVALLYILIVETGFVPYPSEPIKGDETCQFNTRRLKCLSFSPKSWINSEGFYQIFFILAPFPEEKCKLVCVPVGSNMVANMYSTCSRKSFAMLITPAEQVTLYPGEVIFKRLQHLSIKFKSQVVVPIRTVMFNVIQQTTVGLFALPVEVLLNIISYFKVNDFLKWTSTCKYLFHTFSYDEHIWKRFCHLKFCKPSELSLRETHREYYRRKMNFRNRVSLRVSHLQSQSQSLLSEL